jgi:hypothetical protein
LARLDRALSGIHASDSLLRALAGDRCLFLVAFHEPQIVSRQQRFPKPPPAALMEVYGAVGLAAREGTIFLDHKEECLQIAQLLAFQRPPAIRAQEARCRHSRKGLLWEEVDARSIPAMMGHELKRVAQLEVVKTLVAVERHRLAHAGLPETLDQLVPDYLAEVPVDPFDGRPLRYRRTDQGFVVYSVGEDGKDDGGKQEPPRETKKPSETSDLVFRVERQ